MRYTAQHSTNSQEHRSAPLLRNPGTVWYGTVQYSPFTPARPAHRSRYGYDTACFANSMKTVVGSSDFRIAHCKLNLAVSGNTNLVADEIIEEVVSDLPQSDRLCHYCAWQIGCNLDFSSGVTQYGNRDCVSWLHMACSHVFITVCNIGPAETHYLEAFK